MNSEKKYDIAAIGECLIDFVGLQSNEPGKLLLEGNPGGAPANVLACASRLGLKTAFISKLGKDAFGSFLLEELNKADIDTHAVGFVIIDDEKRGKGYGKEMLRLAIRFGFDFVHAEKLTLGVFENNAAIRCYESVGFRPIVSGEAEYYRCMGEKWKAIEMECSKA